LATTAEEQDMERTKFLSLLAFATLVGASPGCGKSGSGGSDGSIAMGDAMASGGVASQAGEGGHGGAVSNGGASSAGGMPDSGGKTSGVTVSGGSKGGAAVGGSPQLGGTVASGGSRGATDAAAGDATGTSGATGGATGATGGSADASSVDGGTASAAWSMGYYASWAPDQYPISQIEWSGLTHIAMAFYLPNQDGSMTLAGGNPQLAIDLVAAAHANGVKAIASIGGSDSQSGFQKATASGSVASFAANLVSLLTTTGYDGIDIDWEPMDTTDEPAVIDIANRIHKAKPGALMTIPIGAINVNLGADLSGFPAIAAVYDQLNLMSYGQAGAWSGWKSWHSSALYQTDSATPTSVDSSVKLYLAAGVVAAKLGIGIGFYGLCYSSPVTGPDQALNGSTLVASDGAISYANIMTEYYSPSARQWDSLARVPYLSFSSPHAPDGCTYISYDDEQSIAEKGAYMKAKGLGGVIEWDLNEAYLSSAAAGQRNPLLKAIHDNVLH
jgi:chitinase